MTPTLPDARARVERLRDEFADKMVDYAATIQEGGSPSAGAFDDANEATEDAAALSRVLAELDRLPRLREACEVAHAFMEHSAPNWGTQEADYVLAGLTAALETP